ncbi:Os06g0525101 [Oryza sativa Japonica Group]|uniref:Os06g0525101 protein n=1 Tax=Oryza sativa subsp. japonica TaxID=39947 RepID=A0A0P0WXN1_ORYSJ|nr:Os06g0525101 [Oryza sativa Japonica Group]
MKAMEIETAQAKWFHKMGGGRNVTKLMAEALRATMGKGCGEDGGGGGGGGDALEEEVGDRLRSSELESEGVRRWMDGQRLEIWRTGAQPAVGGGEEEDLLLHGTLKATILGGPPLQPNPRH